MTDTRQNLDTNRYAPMDVHAVARGSSAADETNRFMQSVYAWMALALVVSGGVAYYVSTNPILLSYIYER